MQICIIYWCIDLKCLLDRNAQSYSQYRVNDNNICKSLKQVYHLDSKTVLHFVAK